MDVSVWFGRQTEVVLGSKMVCDAAFAGFHEVAAAETSSATLCRCRVHESLHVSKHASPRNKGATMFDLHK